MQKFVREKKVVVITKSTFSGKVSSLFLLDKKHHFNRDIPIALIRY